RCGFSAAGSRSKTSDERRMKTCLRLQSRIVAALCFITFLGVRNGAAQETIFNVPSGDVLAKGKIYGEFDFSYLWDTSTGTYTPRLVAGIGHKIEIGLNLNGITSPGPSQTTPTPTFKWKAYDGGNNGWGFVLGDDLFLPGSEPGL